MPAEAVTWVDVEGAVRSWARAQALGVGDRVFFGVNNAVPDPQVVLHRVAGTDRAGDVRVGAVAVGTMHLAKGLEFRAVIVATCDDDVIPAAGPHRIRG